MPRSKIRKAKLSAGANDFLRELIREWLKSKLPHMVKEMGEAKSIATIEKLIKMRLLKIEAVQDGDTGDWLSYAIKPIEGLKIQHFN